MGADHEAVAAVCVGAPWHLEVSSHVPVLPSCGVNE